MCSSFQLAQMPLQSAAKVCAIFPILIIAGTSSSDVNQMISYTIEVPLNVGDNLIELDK
jgi:hypothetical protein